jgi:hypothetical protein
VSTVEPEPLGPLLARLDRAEWALLGLGMPRCPACDLLPASLAAVAAARPGLEVGITLFAAPDDWAERETVLWPRGISVSRASVPALVVLHRGEVVSTRQGSAPAHVLDAWLGELIGPAALPVPPGPTPDEEALLAASAPRRVQHLQVKGRTGL